jgi:hypothetical protein
MNLGFHQTPSQKGAVHPTKKLSEAQKVSSKSKDLAFAIAVLYPDVALWLLQGRGTTHRPLYVMGFKYNLRRMLKWHHGIDAKLAP